MRSGGWGGGGAKQAHKGSWKLDFCNEFWLGSLSLLGCTHCRCFDRNVEVELQNENQTLYTGLRLMLLHGSAARACSVGEHCTVQLAHSGTH